MKKSTDEYVLDRGKIAEDCKHCTAQEWLRLMQIKSHVQGKALSWFQIKQDPELNHEEIRKLLGPYASYERRLMDVPEEIDIAGASTERTAQTTRQLKLVENKPASQPSVARPKKRKLATFGVPVVGDMVHPGNLIVISKINEFGAEELLGEREVEVISGPEWFCDEMIRRTLAGTSDEHQISSVTIYQDKLVLQVDSYASISDLCAIAHNGITISLCQNGTAQESYMLALYLLKSDDECKDYLFFRREKAANKLRNEIIHEERCFAVSK